MHILNSSNIKNNIGNDDDDDDVGSIADVK